jgi:4-amino-4-deoxychorismate lyase
VLINGETGDWLHATDRGLLYGDGLFETVAVIEGKPMLWQRHFRRLQLGCERLRIPPPLPDLLFAESLAALDPHAPRQVLKIIITRGRGARGYAPPRDVVPTRIIGTSPWPDLPEWAFQEGIRVRFCDARLGHNPALAGIKHLNRLEQVVARMEWQDAEIQEGLMLDRDDKVIEGTMSNLFVINERGLLTPDLHQCGVAGVMRELVMDVAVDLGIAVTTGQVDRPMLRQARGLFLTNSLIGIWPVRELDGYGYPTDSIDRRLLRETMVQGFGGPRESRA